MATALSAADLYRSVNKELEDANVKIASLHWLRWQFWRSRKNSANAKHMTSKLKVKYMVQSRQLLKTHIDSYYCTAHFRYLKEYTIKYRNETNLVFEDDKHAVKIGEPFYPVTAIERGKAVLVSTDKKFVVADHDFTKSTFTPTVLLYSKIPEDLSEGFYQGDLHVAIKENSFEHSSILRHAENIKVLDGMPFNPIEAHYHDGGIDHSVRHPKAQIILFAYALSRKVDAWTSLQTAPYNSLRNPMERKMTIKPCLARDRDNAKQNNKF